MRLDGRPKRRILIALLSVLLLAVIGAVILTWRVDSLRWRAGVIAKKATGGIDEIGWADLLSMMRPNSRFDLKPLSEMPNAFAVIRNPYRSEDDLQAGHALFAKVCAACHGPKGEGRAAPSLLGTLKTGESDWALFRAVTGRDPQLSMPPAPVSEEQAWQVVSYVRALRQSRTGGASSSLPLPSDVPSSSTVVPGNFSVSTDRIEHSAEEPQNWLTYSGSYDSWHYSQLDEINASNVAELKLAWSLQLRTDQPVEASPLVVDGIMFLTSPPSDVLAVDAETGDVIWTYARRVATKVPGCCGRLNRGVAILGDKVFVGTLDGYLVALNAKAGRLEWQSKVANFTSGYSITGAPLVVGDQVITGVAGGEFGIRGFVASYDASTGRQRWRFYTIPEPGSPGSESWGGDSWRTGGGPTWVTGSYDPELGLLFWGVGNPSPDFNGDSRPGDNLYTNSVVALNASDGKLVWHFQFTPHDVHDWDSTQVPVLVDQEVGGRMRPLLLWANRNGFYYVLDRSTGEFLGAKAFVKQNWAQRIDERGRPVTLPGSAPTVQGTVTWPGTFGAANWWSPSYSPRTNLFYTAVLESPHVFFKQAVGAGDLAAGKESLGGAYSATGQPIRTGVRALDPETGNLVWEALNEPRTTDSATSGVLGTAGNLVFAGDHDVFSALAADSGKRLWQVKLGGKVRANPMTFAVGGHQRVAIAAGNVLYVFGL